MLGGSIGIGAAKTTYEAPNNIESKSKGFNITPQLAVGVGKNFLVGVGLGYSYASARNEQLLTTSKSRSSTYFGTVFLRKFHPVVPNAGIYAQLAGSYNFGESKATYTTGASSTTDKSKANGFSTGIYPGLYFKPWKKVLLEATFGGLSFEHNTFKPSGGTKSTTSSVNFSLTTGLTIGFRVLI